MKPINETNEANSGTNAESINHPKGENTMDNNNQNFSDDEEKIIKDLENMKINANKTTSMSDEIPAGSYLASITSSSRSVHEDGNYDIVSMEINVQATPYSGRILSKSYHQNTKKGVDFFKREMKEIGHEIVNRHDLDGLCSSLVGTIVVANVVPNESGNQLIYLKNANSKKAVTPVDPDSFW